MAKTVEKIFCPRCEKTLASLNFYTYRDGRKADYCKSCLTAHVDNFDPNTFLWILKDFDVPYIEKEWVKLRNKEYDKDPTKVGGASVMGKYLSAMKLKQHADERFADSERLNEENKALKEQLAQEKEKRDIELKERFENGEINEAEYKTLTSVKFQHDNESFDPRDRVGKDNAFQENLYVAEEDMPDPSAELTQEDKLALALKWGRLYKPAELLDMEIMYDKMFKGFDIQDPDSESALLLLCKTTLKMHQAIDRGDYDSYLKLSRVSDSIRKSAKFTASQNKAESNNYVDCIGNLVVMCERDGFIPRFATDIPQDKVDLTLKDMNNYISTLVKEDLGFGQQIEDSLKKIQIQREMNKMENIDDVYGLLNDDSEALIDKDYEEFYNQVYEEIEADNAETASESEK